MDIVERNLVYTGRVFRVESVQVRLPDGRVRRYDLVNHRGAVTILPLDADGQVWFVRQWRIGAQQELLELPAGVLEEGEDPAVGAAREVREEIGLAAGKLLEIGQFYMAPGYSTELMHVFLATDLYPDPLRADDDEFLEVIRIPLAQVLEMACNGEITDGKTLSSLLLAQKHIEQKGQEAGR